MQGVISLYRSSVGKKITMALTGVPLYGFVIVHMIGNLKIYMGPDKYNHYAEFLRTFLSGVFGEGGFLWIARLVLGTCVVLHIVAATQLTLTSWAARDVKYAKKEDLSFTYASRTMRWGGVIIALFVAYHLLHFTTGNAHPAFDHENVYRNVVTGFGVWWVSLFYIAAMIPLGFHMYHGIWSMTQTLAIENPRVLAWRRPAAAVLALVTVAGNVSIPIAVLSGLVR